MSSATVHVLGSGTCLPVRGGQRRAHPGFFIGYGKGDQHLVLECSQGMAERLEAIGEDPDKITQLAISHAHPDHCALPQFLQTAFCATFSRESFSWEDKQAYPQLSLFAPPHIIAHLALLNRFHFEETVTSEGGSGLAFPVIEPFPMGRQTVRVLAGGARLESFRVHHGFGKVDALAFRLTLPGGKIICYSGDSGFCYGLQEAALNADLFICEASARIGDEKSAGEYGHLSPEQCGLIALGSGVKKLVLTHYSGADTPEAMQVAVRNSDFTGEVVIATDGLIIDV